MKQNYLKSFFARFLTLLVLALLSTNYAWGEVVSGTTYDTKSTTQLPEGWTGSDNNGDSYIKLLASTHYIQTSSFSTSGITSIKLKARTFGGPSDDQKKITVSWYSGSPTTETVLCTISPTSNTLTDYTINSNIPSVSGTGYVKIACKGAASSKGSGVSQVTITYESSDTPAGPTLESIYFTDDAATKLSYTEGEVFDPAGLVVMGKYSEGDDKDVTEDVEWSFSPETLATTTTSVTVTASIDGVEDAQKTVNGITVASAPKFTKVTANKTDWSGEYLLVYENNSTAYVWTGVDAANCNATATISNNQITKPADAVSLTIASMDGGYSILVNGGDNDGKYISGKSGNNTVNFGTAASLNTIAYPYADGNNSVKIVSNTATMRYNNASNNNRFRYFGNAGQQNVQLYEKVLPPTNEAVTFAAPEGGSLVIKNGETPITSGTTIQNGTVLDVTFGMTLAEAYKDVALKVTKTDGGDDVTYTVYDATKKQITMPRYAITVAVTFTKLYKISLVTAGDGTGSATMNGVTTDIYVDDDTQIDLVANAVAPNEFTSWSATENILINEVSEAETYAYASGDGTITATFGISALLPLNAPTLSNPTNITYSGVTLNWEELANAESYNVELLLNDETVASDVITGATSWTPEVTLQANTTYTYTVQGVGDGITYAEDNNPKAQSTVTTADYPAATLTLSENGNTSTIDGKLNTPIDLPTTSTQICEDKVFVGWSVTAIDGETDAEPSLLGETYTFTNPEQLTATIYAVYAKEIPGETANWEITSLDKPGTGTGYAPYNGSHTTDNISYTTSQIMMSSDNKIQFQKNAGYMYNTTPFSGDILFITIADITSNISVYEGSTEIATTPTSGAITLADGKYTFSKGKKYFHIKMGNATGYSSKITVAVAGAPTYSNYCTTFVTKVLESITLSGEYPTEFWKGDAFSHEGMIVTAHYDDESTKDVTSSATFTGYDMTTAGEQTVTVTYDTQSTTYNITVKTIANTAATAYTVAKAKELIDAGKDLDTEVYVKGTVSNISTAFDQSYGNISFDVSADGKTTGQQFRFYRNFKGADKTKWDSAEECPAVDDFVIGLGKLTKYGETYEFAEGNYLVNYTSALMSITSAKLSTFIAPFPVKIPEGVQAYTATAGTDAIVYTEVENVIPECTPVVLYKDVTTTTYKKTCKGSSLATGNSYKEGSLVGTLVALESVPTDVEGAPTYLLQNNSGVVGFYKTNPSNTYTLNANRAYLVGVNSVNAKDFLGFDDNNPTGISEINVSKFPVEGIYDLSGRKLAVPQKGINIINGVKVIVK